MGSSRLAHLNDDPTLGFLFQQLTEIAVRLTSICAIVYENDVIYFLLNSFQVHAFCRYLSLLRVANTSGFHNTADYQ